MDGARCRRATRGAMNILRRLVLVMLCRGCAREAIGGYPCRSHRR